MPEPAHKRQLTSTVYATPLMTPTTALGLSIRLSMSKLRETGDWDIFLDPPERARAETGGADQWVLKRRECSGFALGLLPEQMRWAGRGNLGGSSFRAFQRRVRGRH